MSSEIKIILIVGFDLSASNTLCHVLQDIPQYQPIIVNDIIAATIFSTSIKPDLLILDLDTPGEKSGIRFNNDLYEKYKKEPYLNDVTRIICVSKGISLTGNVRFKVDKPLILSSLLTVIEDALKPTKI